MQNKKSKHIEKIMPLCMALFFCRTVFIGYKYLFFLTLVPCFLYTMYMLFKQGVVRPHNKMMLLPSLVLLLFFIHFSPLSNVVKESVNIVFMVYFILFSKLYYADDKSDAFLKWIVRLIVFAGCIAIIRFVLSMVGISLSFYNVFFEGDGFPLVRDNNFYSSLFIVVLVLSAWLFQQRKIQKVSVFIIVLISIINIGASISRRAYVLYVSLVLILLVIITVLKKSEYRKVFLYNSSLLLVFVIGLFAASAFFEYLPDMPINLKNRYYKLHTFLDREESFPEFNIKQCGKYYSKQVMTDTNNLFFNGDLQRHGLDAWRPIRTDYDCLYFGLIQDECGNNVIRISRGCSNGYWQVYYKGRPIVYHNNVTYKISFVYRVLEGPSNPFFVGWMVYEGDGYKRNLPKMIEPIDSIWYRCSVSYKFQEEQMNPICFLNALQAGSTIEVKDICMTCDDTTGLPRYVDQLPDSVIHKYYSKDSINYFTAPRTARWRYALELWQTRYTTQQKIFGQGFKYLEWYGEKFYNNPNRHDFPHNPIISSFLYSGIIGGVVYVIFLIMSLWLYWKRRKELGIFFIMYLCCMFFSMFSGSSHFSFPLFAFLSFLPFVEVKEKVEPNASSHASATCNCD
ncbi:MAG: O-antigen ligase family protein [Salinivirgaceae bacterium]|nr:O-antigen ligase family protein [Salinivirgaceae bacterium]